MTGLPYMGLGAPREPSDGGRRSSPERTRHPLTIPLWILTLAVVGVLVVGVILQAEVRNLRLELRTQTCAEVNEFILSRNLSDGKAMVELLQAAGLEDAWQACYQRGSTTGTTSPGPSQ